MKKLIILLTALISGCFMFGNLDHNKAKAVAEGLIKTENSEDYEGTSRYYADNFNSAEPMETRKIKLKQLHTALGDLTGFELIMVKDTTDPNELKCVSLVYRVKHTKLNSIEEFVVINDEGDYKVELHSIHQEQ